MMIGVLYIFLTRAIVQFLDESVVARAEDGVDAVAEDVVLANQVNISKVVYFKVFILNYIVRTIHERKL